MQTKGELVNLTPLVRGENDERGLMAFVLWTAIEEAGDWDRLFWDFTEHRKGDLFHWCYYLANDKNPTVLLYFTDKDGALAGSFWFNSYNEMDNSVFINVWIEPAHRGVAAREMAEMATQYAFEVLKVQKIIGITPHHLARNLGVKCGFKETERKNFQGHIVYRLEKEVPTHA